MSSADNLCKQLRPRSGPTKRRACSGSNLFDTQMVFMKEFLKKVNFEKIIRRQKSMTNFSGGIELTIVFDAIYLIIYAWSMPIHVV